MNDNVQKYLRGCEFPCGTNELKQAAQKNNAPQDVISDIRNLPERRYKDAADVQREIVQTTVH